jgi:hypothetical protein
MVIYGLGYIVIQTVFLLLYLHALKQRIRIDLNKHEVFDTKTRVFKQIILVIIGACSILMALLLPATLAGLSGFFYMLISPVFWIFFHKRAKMRRAIDISHS